MQENDRIGGDFDKAINNQFELNSNQVLQEAWELTKTTKAPLFFGALWTFAILMLAMMLVMLIVQAMGMSTEGNVARLLNMAVNAIIVAPLVAGLTLMGIKHSVKTRTNAQEVFRFITVPWPFILTGLITSLITNLGEVFLPVSMALTLLWMLVLGISMAMAIPLVAESALKPFQAVTLSFKVIIRRWFTFFIIYFVMFILFALSLLTLGVGLIWVIPMFYNVQGVIYRQVFGVRKELVSDQQSGSQSESDNSNDDSDNFTA